VRQALMAYDVLLMLFSVSLLLWYVRFPWICNESCDKFDCKLKQRYVIYFVHNVTTPNQCLIHRSRRSNHLEYASCVPVFD
jgi:hypothetical protein